MIRRGIKREGRRKRGKKELSTSYIYIQDWSVGDFPYNNLLPMEEEGGGGKKGLTHLLPLCSWNALVREGVRVRGDSKLENYRRSINRRDSLNVLIHGYVARDSSFPALTPWMTSGPACAFDLVLGWQKSIGRHPGNWRGSRSCFDRNRLILLIIPWYIILDS